MATRIDYPITLESILAAQSDVIGQTVDGQSVLVSASSSKVRVLSSVGSLIWELLDGRRTVGDICSEVAAQFPQVPLATITTDAVEFLQDLRNRGLVGGV